MIKLNNDKAQKIYSLLEDNNYQVFLIGGIVRNFLMGGEDVCYDIDMITNALPEKVIALLEELNIKNYHEKLGCVNFKDGKFEIEITTFRKEKNYSDLRRPDSIEFCDDIHQDLCRRDFTINAIAYNKKQGFIDDFNGFYDTRNNILRTVGDPFKRFEEDALRILRALRFLSNYNLDIEEESEKAIFKLYKNIKVLSSDRINSELSGILKGKNSIDVFLEFEEVIKYIIPELNCFNNLFLDSGIDLYQFIALLVMDAETIEGKYFSLFLLFNSDIIKALNLKIDFDFSVEDLCKKYILNKNIKNSVLKLLAESSIFFKDVNDYKIKKTMNFLNKDIKTFIDVYNKFAFLLKMNSDKDLTSKSALFEERYNYFISNNVCYSKKQLKIDGNDIINYGINGDFISKLIDLIFENVLMGKLANNKEDINKFIEDYKRTI